MTRRARASTRGLRPLTRVLLANAGPRLLLGIALAVLTVMAGIALLGLSGWFITAAGLAGLTASAAAFNVFVPSAGIRLLALLRTAGRYGERVWTHDAALAALAALRERLFVGWARPEAARRLHRRPARLLLRLTADIEALESIVLRIAVPIAAAIGAAALAAVLVGALDARLGLVLGAWLMLVGLGVTARTARLARPLALRRAVAIERLREQAIDLGAGQTDLVMAGRLQAHCETLRATDARLARADLALQGLEARTGAVFSIAGSITLSAVLLAAAALVERGRLDAPAAALVLLVALAAMEPFAALRRGAIEAGRSALAVRRLAPALADEVHRATADSLVSSGPSGSPPSSASTDPGPAAPEAGLACSLSGVRALHEGAPRPAVHDLHLRVALGERIAVIGPSGAGKSTLLSLIAGELTPVAGRVCALPAAWLTQRTELFQDSLADNLRLADAHAGDDRLAQVLRAAGLADDVARFTRGLDTPLGEGGLGLSGGQARRLSLARLLLRPARLWLLDEPTEGLDETTARDVLARLHEQAQCRTLLIATHLAREAMLADRLLVLARGRLDADLRRGTAGFDEALAALRGARGP